MTKSSIWITTFFLGLASGINYGILGASFTIFLNDFKLSYSILGLLSLRLLPYSLKGIWSPIIDILPINFGFHQLGHRKSWFIITLILLFLTYTSIAFYANHEENLLYICFLAIFAAILAATYDNSLHGYRIEFFDKSDHGKSNTYITLSFNIGFYTTLFCALYLSIYFTWKQIFLTYAFLLLPCIMIACLIKEKKYHDTKLRSKKLINNLKHNYLLPFAVLLKKPLSITIIIIAMFYKASDAFMNTLMIPFLLDIGFSKFEVVQYSTQIDFAAKIVGTLIGGYLLSKKKNIFYVLLYVEILASISNLNFILLIDYNSKLLLFTLSFIEGLVSSISNITLITFLGLYCKLTKRFTATFYAVLESFSLFNRIIISSVGGVIAEYISWQGFLITSSLLAIPSIIFCIYLIYNQNKIKHLFGN